MNRLLCLVLLVATLPSNVQAQPQNLSRNFTNSIGMKFVWIPPGTFMMGSPGDEKNRQAHETQHRVTLTRGFFMGVFTVTQEEWQAVMGSNPSHFKGETNLPVENVAWIDCVKFINKLRQKEGRSYRLPSEAEWEYSCRAGTTTAYYFGDSLSTDQANYGNNFPIGFGTTGVNRKRTIAVGSFAPNAFGLHDMHGNVWQWCQDFYGEYPQNDVVDPHGPAKGKIHVLRGGSWYSSPELCRSAYRARNVPSHRNNDYGFRLCFSEE